MKLTERTWLGLFGSSRVIKTYRRHVVRECSFSRPLSSAPLSQKTACTAPNSAARITCQNSQLFEYTSGCWIFNDSKRRSERYRAFDVAALKYLAAKSTSYAPEDIVSLEKLAEGGFNRTFLISMRDGFQLVTRIPYPMTEPKRLGVASEVATIEFLRENGIPVPKIYGYSATTDNAAGTEYILMELMRGTNLGNVWFDLTEKSLSKIISQLVELETRLFSLRFPAGGSLYYTKDLEDTEHDFEPFASASGNGKFCIGPDTTLGLWHGRRSNLQLSRGPYRDQKSALITAAKKEIEFLTRFGRPLQPFKRLYREVYRYREQSPSDHVKNLKHCVKIAPALFPDVEDDSTRPVIRHPDLQPNNVFISNDLQVTGLIDWQHCAILPSKLQYGIPGVFQNYGDDVSESLQTPTLPPDFHRLNEYNQYAQLELLRRRQLHHYYCLSTAEQNPAHAASLASRLDTMKRKVFRHAGDPWEGDSVTLKADLIQVIRNWSGILDSLPDGAIKANVPCPIAYEESEVAECLRLQTAQHIADEQYKACIDVIGVGPEGWVLSDQYEEARLRERKLKADALEAAETEDERREIMEHWIFDDFDEQVYM